MLQILLIAAFVLPGKRNLPESDSREKYPAAKYLREFHR
jgi:hypothetical protein